MLIDVINKKHLVHYVLSKKEQRHEQFTGTVEFLLSVGLVKVNCYKFRVELLPNRCRVASGSVRVAGRETLYPSSCPGLTPSVLTSTAILLKLFMFKDVIITSSALAKVQQSTLNFLPNIIRISWFLLVHNDVGAHHQTLKTPVCLVVHRSAGVVSL